MPRIEFDDLRLLFSFLGRLWQQCVTQSQPVKLRRDIPLRRWLTSRILFLLLLYCSPALLPVQAQQVAVSWNGGTGNWSTPINWSPVVVPNNDGTTTYSVGIAAPSSVVAMDVLQVRVQNLTLGATNTLSINAGNGLTLCCSGTSNNFGTLTNYGRLGNVGSIFNPGGGLNNYGSLNNFGGISNTETTMTNYATFSNSGGISNEGGFGLINASGANLFNSGSIFNDYVGRLTNSGTLINAAGASITNGDFGSSSNTFGAYLINAGIIYASDGTFDNDGTLISSGRITVNNYATLLNGGTLTNSGTISSSNVIQSSGTFTNAAGAFTYISGGGMAGNSAGFFSSGRFDNFGTITIDTSCPSCVLPVVSKLSNSGTLSNFGTIVINGNLVNSGTMTNNGAINNSGSGAVTISTSGLFTTSTNYTQMGGKTVVDGTLTATAGAIVDIRGGTLSGSGFINGDVLMGGTLMPGDSPGTLTIFGKYEQTATGILDMLLGTQSHSFLDVGNAILDPGALLQITLLDGFNPFGQTFEIMHYSTLEGEFVNGSSFWDDGYLWQISYAQNALDVTAVSAPEPSSFLLLGIGLLALAGLAVRRTNSTNGNIPRA
jgi:hypothetical protein